MEIKYMLRWGLLKWLLPVYSVLLVLTWPQSAFTVPVALFLLWVPIRKKPAGKVLKWLLPALLLVVLLIFGIPGQNKLACEFDDGDQMVIRQNYRYYPWVMYLRAYPWEYSNNSPVYYKPKGWIEGWRKVGNFGKFIGFIGESDMNKSYRLQYCSNFSKIGGTVAFKSSRYKLPGIDWRGWKDFSSKEALSELDKKMEEMELTREGGSSFTQIDASTLLRERPLINNRGCCKFKEYKGYPPCLVQAVLQTYSHDGGQTWDPLVLTEDSKLYELGKPLYEQKGVARPADWTEKP